MKTLSKITSLKQYIEYGNMLDVRSYIKEPNEEQGKQIEELEMLINEYNYSHFFTKEEIVWKNRVDDVLSKMIR
tara:strand:+ start:1731 stop:1952 length:222 start_codon:yes stop_codon:yes gene_type:complete